MRPLERLRDDIHHLNTSLLIDLARKTILTRPLMRRPRRSFLRRRIFVVLALEAKRLIAPRELQETKHLFERLAIDAIAFALIAGSGADVNLLCHLIEPPRLIATRETHECAALGQL